VNSTVTTLHQRASQLLIVVRDTIRKRTLFERRIDKYCQTSRDFDSNWIYIHAAASWLARAQDVTTDGGVAAYFHWKDGWCPSYPETSGYIIPTFIKYAHVTGADEFAVRAKRVGRWLLEQQNEDGSFPGLFGNVRVDSRVFNTGQILLGLVALFREFGGTAFLESARKACQWLANGQESSGQWVKHSLNDFPKAYHSRVAWAMLEANQKLQEDAIAASAVRNLKWVLGHQLKNGWFMSNSFDEDELPYLHTIAYAARGLLEAGALLQDSEMVEAALRTSEKLMRIFEVRKYLPATFDENWRSSARYICMTGCAQMTIVWLKSYLLTKDLRYVNASLKMVEYLKSTVNIRTRNADVRGALKGSDPVWGQYERFSFPNWATKFYLDALLLLEEVMEPIENRREPT